MFQHRNASPSGSTRHPILALLALGALLAGSWQCLRSTHRRRLEGRPQRLPERLETWEGEGGRPPPEAEPGAATGGAKVQAAASSYGPPK